MTFPTISYKYNGNENAKVLATVVDQKLNALEKFIGADANVTCEVEFEKVTAHAQGPIYRVEVNLFVNGDLYRAEATEENFEKAIDEVRNELDRELSRAKDKHMTLEKQNGRDLKQMLNQ
jgi:ribosomal subunit interface protein